MVGQRESTPFRVSPTAERAVSGAVPVQTINIGGNVGTVNAPAVGNVNANAHEVQTIVHKLYDAVISAGDIREQLWSGINARFKAGVPKCAAPNAQAMTDIGALVRAGTLADGSAPLVQYLENLTALRGHDVKVMEAVVMVVTWLRANQAQQSPATRRAKPTRDEMVDMLARLPLCGTWSGRNALVVGFTGYFSRTEHDDKRIDLGKIVDQSWKMDRERAWAELLDAAHRQVRGTGLGNQILAARQALG